MFDLLIKDGTVITVDSSHTVYPRGYVAVKDGTIAGIGPMEELPPENMAKKVIDAEGLAVMPGLIDGHGHGGHCLIKNLGDHYEDWDNMAEEIYFRYTDDFFWYAEGALAAAERVKFGITTGVSMIGSTPRPDGLESLEAHFEGALKTGIRELSGIGFCDGPWPKRPVRYENGMGVEKELTPMQVVENTERAVKELNGRNSRQMCIVGPGNITPWGDDTREFSAWKNREMARIAREYGVAFHTHARAGGIEFAYETTPELLTPTTSLTHSTGLSEREIKILAETGAAVFHGPTTRANINVRCPVYEILRAGGEVVIVTDGTAPDRSYDIWRDMKVFQVIHRLHEHNDRLAPPGRVLEMCTIRAARALGIDKITGSLEKGKSADIIIIDTMQPHLQPFGVLPEARLVYHAQGGDVMTSIIEGQVVMENRRLLLCDEKKIISDARKAQSELFERLGEERVRKYTSYPGLYELEAETVR